MTKTAVRAALGLETDAALADLLGVTRAAVAQWPDDQPIPEKRRWQLIALRPSIFGNEQKSRGAA